MSTSDKRSPAPTPGVPTLIRSTFFETGSSQELARQFVSRSDRCYIRFGNPTVRAAAQAVAEFEGAEAGLLFGSGMAAIATTLFALTREGSHMVAQRNMFAQTYSLFADVASRFGMTTTFVDATDAGHIREAVTPATSLIYIETPSNPLLDIVDIAAVSEIAGAYEVPLIVDGTFATPLLQRPLSLGATLVVHSATKYLGGHSDICAGAVLGSQPWIGRIYEMQRLLGGIVAPDTAWMLQRSLKTLELRVTRQSRSAALIASFLDRADGVMRVSYPTLPGSRFQDVARRQMTAGGGMITFEVRGGLEAARSLLDGCNLVRIATSLGGAETVAEIPAELDFATQEIGGTETGAQQVPEGLVRLSVGLEDPEAVIADLDQALRLTVASEVSDMTPVQEMG